MFFRKFIYSLALLAFSLPSFALPRHDPVPGGIAVIPLHDVEPSAQVYFNKKRVAIVRDQNQSYALVGIPLRTKPGKKSITLKRADGQLDKVAFDVNDKTYKAQYLTIKNKRKVNPNADDMKRITAERVKKRAARTHWSEQPVRSDFIIPVHGRISSIFGLRRFFNNQPRNPHSGLDIAAPEGTPIKAVESGTVLEASNFFFSGNVVYIDHGQGLISMYAHMHSMDVKPGDRVDRGQVIGTVGQTGRVTGAHLHLGLIANQTLVDPVLFLPPLDGLSDNSTP